MEAKLYLRPWRKGPTEGHEVDDPGLLSSFAGLADKEGERRAGPCHGDLHPAIDSGGQGVCGHMLLLRIGEDAGGLAVILPLDGWRARRASMGSPFRVNAGAIHST